MIALLTARLIALQIARLGEGAADGAWQAALPMTLKTVLRRARVHFTFFIKAKQKRTPIKDVRFFW